MGDNPRIAIKIIGNQASFSLEGIWDARSSSTPPEGLPYKKKSADCVSPCLIKNFVNHVIVVIRLVVDLAT